MYKITSLFSFAIIVISFFSCANEEKDDEYPIINISGQDAFPKNCDTVYLGETFVFKATFSDNFELGSFTTDIHHNFDHHSHSSFDEECTLDQKKDPENPFLFMDEFEIPDGLSSFNAVENITIPTDVDAGDYHFTIRLTDKEGWQEILGISIKIKAR